MFGDPFLEYRANIRDTQIRVKSMVGDITWRIGHDSEKFRLVKVKLPLQQTVKAQKGSTGIALLFP
jgi:hypothetical protein